MKSNRLVRKMFDKVVYCVPVVVLERITIPTWMEKKSQQNDESGNEEPKSKKFKTEKEEVEVPKVIMSKNLNSIQMKLKFPNKDILKKSQNKELPPLSAKINTGLKNRSNKIILNKKKAAFKRASEKNIEQSTLKNSLSMSKIKLHNIRTMNENFDLIKNKIMLFDTEKPDVSRVNSNIPLIFPRFETNQLTLQYFELLHKKYFDKHIQDTIVIINNIVFMNLLTNIHCISRINWILRWKDKHKMTQNIQFQSILHIKYVNILDNVLKKNCIDIISNFEDSDYEQAFLMLMLSLFASLKMFGSNVFKNSSVILKKLERLQWESVKHQHFDHNKVLMTFKSDVFCSCYHKLSKLIGEGSYTDPNIVKLWELFCSPAIFKATYFRSAIKAITNSADLEKVASLIDKASKNIRLYSHLKNGENSPVFKRNKLKKLIALVNDSTRVNTNNNNETSQPCISGFDALNQINQSMMSVKDERTYTPSIIQTKTFKSSELNTLNEEFSETCLTNTLNTPIPYRMKVCQLKNTSTTVHTEIFQNLEPIKYKNLCTPHKTGVHTRTAKPSNTLYKNYHNTTNIPATSTPTFVKVYPVRNTSIPHLNTDPLIDTYLHKKFNSTIQIGNVKYRINRTLFHRMISKPSEASIKLISSSSLSNNTNFDGIGRENYKSDAITTGKHL